jgi:hypothetical protein
MYQAFSFSKPGRSQEASTSSSTMEVDVQDRIDIDDDLDEVPMTIPYNNDVDYIGKFRKEP